MKNIISISVLFLLINTIGIEKLFAQGPDSLFHTARDFAFTDGPHKSRDSARYYCRKALQIAPKYSDVGVFLARLHTWDGNYDSARPILREIIERDTNNEDAINAMIDLEYWSDHPVGAEAYANKGLAINPNSEDFNIKKIKAIGEQKRYTDALTAIDTFLKKSPGNQKAIDYRESILEKMRTRKLGVNYDIDLFSNSNSQLHLLTLSLAQRTRIGTVIFYNNLYRRFYNPTDLYGNQIEVDAYPSIGYGMYMYLNAGIAFDKYMFEKGNNTYLFPDFLPLYRFGASLYKSLPLSLEAEIGFRWLGFPNPVIIYTGSLGWYFSDFWFSFRPYITPNNTYAGVYSRSFMFLTRWYYLGNSVNYHSMTISTGYSPDDRSGVPAIIKSDSSILRNYKVRLETQRKLNNRIIINARVAADRQTISNTPIKTRFQYSAGLGVYFLF